MKDMAVGVKHLHGLKLLHRDLKPLNVLVLNGRLKIGDLGLARELPATSNMTGGVGTRGWRAPENEKKRYTFSVDVFALGLIFLSMLCHKFQEPLNPPTGVLLAQWMMVKHHEKKDEELHDDLGVGAATAGEDKDLVQKVVALIRKMLAVKPEDRGSIDNVCQLIDDIIGGQGQPAGRATQEQRAGRETQRQPAGRETQRQPAGRETQRQPAGRETQRQPAGRETQKQPAGRETQRQPAGRETQGKPAGRETQKQPAGRETQRQPAGRETQGRPAGKARGKRKADEAEEDEATAAKMPTPHTVTIDELYRIKKCVGKVLQIQVLDYVYLRAESSVRYIHIYAGDHTSVEANGSCLLVKAYDEQAKKLQKMLEKEQYLAIKGNLKIKMDSQKQFCPKGSLDLSSKEVEFDVGSQVKCPEPQAKPLSHIQLLDPASSRVKIEEALVVKVWSRNNQSKEEEVLDMLLYDGSEDRCRKVSVRRATKRKEQSLDQQSVPYSINIKQAFVYHSINQKALRCRERDIEILEPNENLRGKWYSANIAPEKYFQPPFKNMKSITEIVKVSKNLKKYWPEYFRVTASIEKVLWEKPIWNNGQPQQEKQQDFAYLGCSNETCRLKVEEDGAGGYRCGRCKSISEAKWRYRLRLQLGDYDEDSGDSGRDEDSLRGLAEEFEGLDLDYNAVKEGEREEEPMEVSYGILSANSSQASAGSDEYYELKATAFGDVAEKIVGMSATEAEKLYRTSRAKLEKIFTRHLDKKVDVGIKASKGNNEDYGPDFVIERVFALE